MSAFHIVQAVEAESLKGAEVRAYQLELVLRSGRRLIVSPYKSSSYYLKAVDETTPGQLSLTYIPYEQIEQVTPIWL